MLYGVKKVEVIDENLNEIEFRKQTLLKSGEINLHIKGEDRDGKTNLRIFSHNKVIHFRVDKNNNFDYTLDKVQYLENEQPILETIVKKYGFDNANLYDIDDIIELTKDMKRVKQNNW